MTDQWGRFRKRLALEQDESLGLPTGTFYNYSSGTYDPDGGKVTGRSRSQIAQEKVEYIPPSIDTSVDSDGTSVSWDTSIRFPDSDGVVGQLVTLGEDSEKPTEVEVADPEESDPTVYQLHGYSVEQASGMLMCRLVEL